MGLFEVLDVFNKFQVATGVFMLDIACLRTEELENMKHVATKNQFGYSLMAPSAAIEYLVQLVTNPVSPEEAYTINTALKTLDLKKNGNTRYFYEVLEDAMAKRLIFTKLTQIFAPLIEELKINKELLIMLVNYKLLDMTHLQELAGDEVKIAHYAIHNINTYRKLKKFMSICRRWCRDTNLIELIFEITFNIECFQMAKLGDRINDDMKIKACLLY